VSSVLVCLYALTKVLSRIFKGPFLPAPLRSRRALPLSLFTLQENPERVVCKIQSGTMPLISVRCFLQLQSKIKAVTWLIHALNVIGHTEHSHITYERAPSEHQDYVHF